MNETIVPALLTVKEASAYLAVSEKTLYNLTVAGRLQAVSISKRCKRYEKTTLDQFVEGCRG